MAKKPNLLLLESATSVCSVCVSIGTEVLSMRETKELNKHSQFLAPFAQECLQTAGLTFDDLDAVAVSAGPGSYTGLRVGASTAKGICYASNVHLIGVDNLEALAWGAKTITYENDIIVPMIDARRMEVYMATFDAKINRLTANEPKILEVHMFDHLIELGHRIIIVGDGTPKAAHVFDKKEEVLCEPRILSSSKQLIQPTLLAFGEQRFEDIFQFAPGYLKPPNITKSTKSMI